MTGDILLLGHVRDTGLELARLIAAFGFAPKAVSWKHFSIKQFGRRPPALVIADADRPDALAMDELCRATRSRWGEGYPVLAVTRSRRFQRLASLLDAGASDCLALPVSAAQFGKKMIRLLDGYSVVDSGPEEEETPERLAELFASGNLLRLGDIAAVHAGVAPRRATFRRMAPPDEGWRGVLTSEEIDRFMVGKPESYLRWSRLHLFRLPAPEEYAVREKVLVRRAGPPMAAAVDRSGLPAGADVYSVVPGENVSAGFIACLLNSRLVDFYCNRIARVGVGGRLRIEELRDIPVPPPDAESSHEFNHIAVMLAHFGSNPESWIDRQNRDELWERMEKAVFALYGADKGVERELAALHF